MRLCKRCQGDDLTHITQCEADGHRDHHAGCCPDWGDLMTDGAWPEEFGGTNP